MSEELAPLVSLNTTRLMFYRGQVEVVVHRLGAKQERVTVSS